MVINETYRIVPQPNALKLNMLKPNALKLNEPKLNALGLRSSERSEAEC